MNNRIARDVAQVRALFAEVAPAVHVRETVLRYLAVLEAGYREQHPAVGSRQSLRALIETSAHPAAAGVSEALLALLK